MIGYSWISEHLTGKCFHTCKRWISTASNWSSNTQTDGKEEVIFKMVGNSPTINVCHEWGYGELLSQLSSVSPVCCSGHSACNYPVCMEFCAVSFKMISLSLKICLPMRQCSQGTEKKTTEIPICVSWKVQAKYVHFQHTFSVKHMAQVYILGFSCLNTA